MSQELKPRQPPGITHGSRPQGLTHQVSAWYAGQARMDSRTKLVVMDDRGILHYGRGAIEFHGKKRRMVADRIVSVTLVRPAFAYVTWLWMLPLLAALMLLYAVIDPVTLWAGAIGGAVGVGVGLVVNRMQHFVRVEGEDAGGGAFVAYFHVATGFGWGGILGGTRRAAEVIGG